MELLTVTSRSAAVLLDPDGLYEAKLPFRLRLNGRDAGVESCSVCSLFGLRPDTEYRLEALADDREPLEIIFHTQTETIALDVRAFGAKGDGETDDTAALQAAVLCCPNGGRVWIPAGRYMTGPLFLKSHITLEIAAGAALLLKTERTSFPVLPGVTLGQEGQEDYLLGSWEGNPLSCYAACLNGIGVEDVRIIGEGAVDGQGRAGDWWDRPKAMRHVYRPRLLYLRDCRNIIVHGLTFRNSPSWNLHPCFSQKLDFINIRVEAPDDSPNTDGFDPESCRDIRLLGAVFSVGDDCVAVKSGKIYMGMKYHTPSENIEIGWCAMLRGHSGVTIGSEMSGGVRNIVAHHCLIRGNDRGLRIKTRRGRGKYGMIDEIFFRQVRMEDVKAPLVVNCLYFCDPDGHSEYVQSREKQPVDDTTPSVGAIRFEQVEAVGCRACAAYILGLPENPVREVLLKDCVFTFSEETQPMLPAMAEGVETCKKQGVIARFAHRVCLQNVRLSGIESSRLMTESVDTAEDIP